MAVVNIAKHITQWQSPKDTLAPGTMVLFAIGREGLGNGVRSLIDVGAARSYHQVMNTEYLTCAETAKLVRKALARSFPGVKFSVRSDVYSNGASIRVHYQDAALDQREVQQVAERYAGSDFDGMIDMKYSRRAFLDEDGEVHGYQDPGTVGSGGSIPAQNDVQPANTRLVRFGADFVFVTRDQ